MRFLVRLAAAALLALLDTATSVAAPTGRYDVALLRARFTDQPTTLFTVEQLERAADEMSKFFGQISQGRLELSVHLADITLPRVRSDCNDLSTFVPECLDDAAEAAADDGFDFDGIEGILLVNAGCHGQAWTMPPTTIDRPGVNGRFQRAFASECRSATLPSTIAWGGWAHEIGHQFESYEGRSEMMHPTGYSSGYNLMDSCYPCGASVYALAPEELTNETAAVAHKLVFPGWVAAERIAIVDPPAGGGETVVLTPVSDAAGVTAAPLGIKVPVARGRYFFVEARRQLRADAWGSFADEGVQIHFVDESRDVMADTVDPCDADGAMGCVRNDSDPRAAMCQSPPNLATTPFCWPYRLWQAGQSYADTTTGITIRVDREVGNGYSVTVLRDNVPDTPDMAMTPWLTPPSHSWETVDIWVDSSCNGYEAAGGDLRYGRRADGTVIGNGDDPCANHPNRVYAAVRNIGDAAATDVQVTISVTNPLGVGITDVTGWEDLGTASAAEFPVLASLAPGGEATVWVEWTPEIDLAQVDSSGTRFAYHSCLKVSAEPLPGELVATNLDGEGEQENLDQFEIPAGVADLAAIERYMWLFTPDLSDGDSKTWYFQADAALPEGWEFEIAGGARRLTLAEGERRRIPVKIIPSGPVDPGTTWHLKVGAYSLEPLDNPLASAGARKHYHAVFSGGVDFMGHGVRDSSVLVEAADDGGAILVKGMLEPALKDTWITIDYHYQPNGRTISRTVRTGPDGSFFDRSVDPARGLWRIQALWQGTGEWAAAVSEAVLLKLQ